jgi:SAM-dependent methyltransferase
MSCVATAMRGAASNPKPHKDPAMRALAKTRHWPATVEPSSASTASAYDRAGDNYLAYADGDPWQLYAFTGCYAYGDRRLWSTLDARLVAHRASGATSISILDAGCGPGTWLRRLVVRARALGFTEITARGFDVAQEQVLRARRLSADLAALPGVELRFDVADLTETLPEADAGVDLSLCLYCVLNHVPVGALTDIVAELARVTRGHFVTTVRAVGSAPTIYVDGVDQARQFRQDHQAGRVFVEMRDGRRIAIGSHLFGAAELRQLAEGHFDVDDLRGLDLFHGRFAPDPRWNPATLEDSDGFRSELARLEERYGADPAFIDHATHLLLVARARDTGRRAH